MNFAVVFGDVFLVIAWIVFLVANVKEYQRTKHIKTNKENLLPISGILLACVSLYELLYSRITLVYHP